MLPSIDWGVIAAIASAVCLFGLAMLSLLVFAQARELRALREKTYEQARQEEHAEPVAMR